MFVGTVHGELPAANSFDERTDAQADLRFERLPLGTGGQPIFDDEVEFEGVLFAVSFAAYVPIRRAKRRRLPLACTSRLAE